MRVLDALPPGTLLVLGALLLPLARGRARAGLLVGLPLASLAHQLLAAPGGPVGLTLFGYALEPVRIDALSTAFGVIFHGAALLGAVYALHVREPGQHVAALAYAGSAIGAVFAGDLLTLFLFWELTSIASVFLVWARRTPRAYAAGMRYLVVQVGSGVLLLAGTAYHARDTGSVAFDALDPATPGGVLLLLAFGIKAAFPLLHAWLPDAYPEATVTGAVFLSAFTTKMAVYALARGFAGLDLLVPIGLAMTVFPVVWAFLANDLRRVLAYSLVDQLGFMIVAIGIGTPLAIDGAVAHAVTHVLYKSLLFMSVGAVLLRTGSARATDLGGLARSMPWTTACCAVGTASIAAVPLFCGYVSKTIILVAVAEDHRAAAFVILLAAAAAVLVVPGVRVPWAAFFGTDRGLRCAEAPWNMRAAMGATAFGCILLGVAPGLLFALLPHGGEDIHVYTAGHVATQVQLLAFAGLAFAALARAGAFPGDARVEHLDADWTYRRALPAVSRFVLRASTAARTAWTRSFAESLDALIVRVYRHHGPEGVFARTWLTGSAVLWVLVLLFVALIVYYA